MSTEHKAVLLSIRPEWCVKILNGEKTVEIRKNRPKLKPPFKCYIYCTKAPKKLITIFRDGDVFGDGGKSRMTRKEMFDLRIASDGFRYAVRKALFECSKFPPCTERMIVEGRLAEALYFSERMMEKTYKDLETEEKTNVG